MTVKGWFRLCLLLVPGYVRSRHKHTAIALVFWTIQLEPSCYPPAYSFLYSSFLSSTPFLQSPAFPFLSLYAPLLSCLFFSPVLSSLLSSPLPFCLLSCLLPSCLLSASLFFFPLSSFFSSAFYSLSHFLTTKVYNNRCISIILDLTNTHFVSDIKSMSHSSKAYVVINGEGRWQKLIDGHADNGIMTSVTSHAIARQKNDSARLTVGLCCG